MFYNPNQLELVARKIIKPNFAFCHFIAGLFMVEKINGKLIKNK